MSVITQLPTMCNPDTLSNEERKAELLRLQGEIVLLGDKLHSMNTVAFRQAEILTNLVDAYVRQDTVFIASQLQVLADHREKQRAAQQAPKPPKQNTH